MSKKYLITSDTHLGRNNSNGLEQDLTTNFFSWLSDLAKERGISQFIHLGDVFDNRKNISLPSLDAAIDIVKNSLSSFDDVYLLIGNHDTYFKTSVTPTSLKIFEVYPNIHVIKEPTVLNDILLVPWLVDNYYMDDIIDNTFGTKYLFGHLSLNEILLNCSGSRSEKEMFSKLDFKKYDMVLSGHFHTKGQYENILYIGAPYHMSFNDSGPRGVYIFDEGSIEFIEYNGAPKCYILNAESYDESVIPNNNIRLDFYSSLGINEINKILKKVENLNPAYLQISYKFSKEFTNQSTVDIINNTMGNKEILLDYIKTSSLSAKINMKTLENIINTLEKE